MDVRFLSSLIQGMLLQTLAFGGVANRLAIPTGLRRLNFDQSAEISNRRLLLLVVTHSVQVNHCRCRLKVQVQNVLL